MKFHLNRIIQFFGYCKESILKTISPKTNCTSESLYDFYCDAERPFVH